LEDEREFECKFTRSPTRCWARDWKKAQSEDRISEGEEVSARWATEQQKFSIALQQKGLHWTKGEKKKRGGRKERGQGGYMEAVV